MAADRGSPDATSALYSGPIIDAHQHFWDPSKNCHPWLSEGGDIPFRYGDYGAIKRRYLPDDYRADADAHAVVQTVYIETEWDPRDPVGETRYATSLAERYGWPNAIVAQAWLDREDVADVLDAQSRHSLVRGVRHKPGGASDPADARASPSLMSDERWRRGYALLAGHGMMFDLQTAWWHLDEAGRLADDFPGIPIILNHTGLPSDRSEAGLRQWHAAMTRFAERPNASVKISGLGQRGMPWSVAANAWIVRETIAMFGPHRAMFASNFPVDSLCASYDTILSGFKHIVAALPAADQAALFHGTAERMYRPARAVLRLGPGR
jgi:predicted TIM-barrel fold metal-dependent hydrolase